MPESPSVPERGGAVRRLRRLEPLARMEIALAAFAIWLVLRLLRLTVTVERDGGEELERCWREGRPVLLAFWHGRSIMLPFFYRGPGACIMNSSHRDGEIITRALARFGIASTRGSSTRGGVGGMLGLVRAQRRGMDLALIPDGPRGPAGVAKAGIIELALISGAPMFPLAFASSRPLRLPTWDRMMLPRPFSRVVISVGEPLHPAEAASEETRAAARERLRVELERRLRDVTRRADVAAGAPQVEEL